MRGAFPGEAQPGHDPIGHLELAANCDAYLVAPASANTIAKLAAGIADSMLTTSFLACTAPRLVAPAMNDRMYADAATQANLATLRERGVEVIEPEEGKLASRGEYGRGRLPDPERAAGPGRGGAAGRRAALGRPAGPGHRRRHPRADRPGPLHRQPLQRPDGHRPGRRRGPARGGGDPDRRQRRPARAGRRPPHRRRDRRRAGRRPPSEEFAATHVLLMAAAPADFRAAEAPPARSRARARWSSAWSRPRTSSPRSRPAAREGQTVVGFAAEHGGDAVDRARAKLTRKDADLIVLNDVSDPEIGFESDDNAVTLIDAAERDRGADRRQGRDRRGDPRPRSRAGLRPRHRRAAESAPRRRRPAPGAGYTGLKLFCPYLFSSSRSGPGPLFLRPEPGMNDLQQNIQQQLDELDSRARPGRPRAARAASRCGSSSTTPAASTWRSANGSPSTSTTCGRLPLEVSSPGPKYRRPSTASETKESPQ